MHEKNWVEFSFVWFTRHSYVIVTETKTLHFFYGFRAVFFVGGGGGSFRLNGSRLMNFHESIKTKHMEFIDQTVRENSISWI